MPAKQVGLPIAQPGEELHHEGAAFTICAEDARHMTRNDRLRRFEPVDLGEDAARGRVPLLVDLQRRKRLLDADRP